MTNTSNLNFAAVITAAGKSRRMRLGIKKEYLSLPEYGEGVCVLSECIFKFLQTKLFSTIVIVVPKHDIKTANALIFSDKRISEELNASQTKVIFTEGGNSRQRSVFNALKILSQESFIFKYVLIHDGARPWVSTDLIARICSATKKHGAAVPGYQAIDTQKVVDSSGQIKVHLERSTIYSVQTPQGFEFEKLLHSHHCASRNHKSYTDDSEIYAEFACPVFICKGEIASKKITFKEDIK